MDEADASIVLRPSSIVHRFVLQRLAPSQPADTTCAKAAQQNGAGGRDSVGG